MPITGLNTPTFKPPKEAVASWNTWRGGWNNLLRENEIDRDELVDATNLLLKGSGVPKPRWGSKDYHQAGPTANPGLLVIKRIKDSSDNQQLLTVGNWGFLTKKSGTSYTEIAGASWPSGSNVDIAQLAGNAYIVSDEREMVRYDFNTLTSFPTLSTPETVLATNLSTASFGLTTYSWRVTAASRSGGETIASTPVSLVSLPQNLENALVRVSWAALSAASGDLIGYNIYRGAPGDEYWVGGVGKDETSFDDFGTSGGDIFRTVPVANTTGGPKAKFIIRYQDRLILAGIPGEPTKVLVSGRYPYQERFDWYSGGGYVFIEPDSGENITGLGIFQEKLVVFKENSVWQVNLEQVQFGQYLILDPQYQLLTASQGCTSHKSIVPVENDVMFANRNGLYILRQEPQLLNVLNANEISAKIRDFFETLSDEDHRDAAAVYANKKYVISYPRAKKSIIFDRERLAFMGPWPTPFGISDWEKFIDDTGTERWVAADYADSFTTEFSENYTDDKGEAINTLLKTKKEDFDDWTLFKTINEVFLYFRAITGQIEVNIYIENRNGNVVTAKSFTISGSTGQGTAGLGIDQIGTTLLGDTEESSTVLSEDEEIFKAFIYKTARTAQIEVRSSGLTSSFELLGSKIVAIPQARGNNPSSWVV